MIKVWADREAAREAERKRRLRYKRRVLRAECVEANPNDLAVVLAA